jgi:hypothetical protein
MIETFKRLLKRVAQFGVLLLAALASLRGGDDDVKHSAMNGGTGSGNGTSGDLTKGYDKIVDALPDGVPVKYDDFKSKVGTDLVSLLPGANPDTITRNGNHITIDSSKESTQALGSAELKLAKRVEFDLTSAGGALSLTNVKGIKVSVSSGAPAFELHQVNISRDGSGNTTISGKLNVSRFLPYLPFKFTIGPDGQLVSGK